MTTATAEISLAIQAKGEVISSNFPAFAEMVRARLGEINRDLATDDDFDQADADAKAIQSAEKALKEAKAKALEDAEQLHALFEGIDMLSAELAAARLDLAGQITRRKAEVKAQLVEEFLGLYDIDPRDALRQFGPGLQGAIKGKKTIDSMRQACRVYQMSTQAVIAAARETIARFEKTHGADLIPDRRELELKQPGEIEVELRRRWEAKKAREEAGRLRAEAAAAHAKAAEAMKPEPVATPTRPTPISEQERRGPRIGALPTGPTPRAEWEDFKAALIAAFAPVKAKREALRHPENQARAATFAAALGAAWKEANQ
jgi:phosphopantetheinyl transferase (holo-ACP synthase)